jgi:hypothetical protein
MRTPIEVCRETIHGEKRTIEPPLQMEIQERAANYKGPNLDPTGVRFRRRRLGSDLCALMASRFDHLIAYLWWLLREVDTAVRLGLTSDAAVEAITLDKRFLVSRFSPASRLNPLLQNFHRLNVLATYRSLTTRTFGSHRAQAA